MADKMRTGRYDRPVPEPHFIPGYTGHCPDMHYHIGMTYPWATHAVLEEKPYCAGRLSPIRPPRRRRTYEPIVQRRDRPRIQKPPAVQENREEDDRIIGERRAAQRLPVLGVDMSPGYGGHVPRERESFGRTPEHVYRRAISDFERQQRTERGDVIACSSFCQEHVELRPGRPRTSGIQENREEDDRIIKERRAAQRQPVLGADMASGYAGHVPKRRDSFGRTPEHIHRRAISDFERQQQAERGGVGACSPACQELEESRRDRARPHRARAVEENREEDERIIRERRAAQKHPLLGVDVACGYGGHVPQERDVYGRTHQNVYRRAISDFERQQREVKGCLGSSNCTCDCHT